MKGAPRLVASLALSACGLAACGPDPGVTTVVRSAEEHGAALVGDPSLGASSNRVSCLTCHDVDRPPESRKPGAPLRGMATRASYWGGAELDLLPSMSYCLTYFMRREPLDASSKEARAIYAYLVSLGGDSTPWPFSVPFAPTDPGPGSVQRGEVVYGAACASCHGALGSGAGALVPEAPALPGDTLASHPPPEYTPDEQRLVFVQKVRHGPFLGYGGAMPPLSPEVLPDAELADLLAYLGL